MKTTHFSKAEREQNLRETLASYRALITASGIGAWEYHIDSGYLNCNDIYFSMLGKEINEEDISGKSCLKEAWTDLLHPDDLLNAQDKFSSFIKNKTSDSYESFFRLKNVTTDEWIWIWSRGKLILDENAKPFRAIGTHIDVSAQKKAEQGILEERMLLRTLIDNLPDTIYVKDAEGRKVIANMADVRSIGAASEADVIGKTDIELFEDKVVGRRGYDDDRAVLTNGQSLLNKEECFIDRKGGRNWLLTSKIPVFDQSGNVVQLLGIGHNITQRKIDDEAIRKLNLELKSQAEDLKTLNEQLTASREHALEKALAQGKFEIASEVLHDIGNALVGFGSHLTRINKITAQQTLIPAESLAMFMNSQVSKLVETFGVDKASALVKLSANLSVAQQKNNDEIASAVKELIHIVSHVQEILNIQRQFVRGQEGKHERKAVDLLRIVEDCRAMMHANFVRRGIEFVLSSEPGDYLFNGDPTKIMQVMLNIQKNAMEAIPINAKDKTVSLTLKTNTNGIELMLNDSGSGFDADTGEHLFERGFTTKENGTGLGLYNCRSIIESHNGSFMISSVGLQRGSTVTIRLPRDSRS